MNCSHRIAAALALMAILGVGLVGCTDVGDDSGATGTDAAGVDATAIDGEGPEAGSDAAGDGDDGEPGSDGGLGGDAEVDAGVATMSDAEVGGGLDATTNAEVEGGLPAAVDAGIDAGVDAGMPPADAGVDASADGGIAVGVEAGVDAGAEAGVDAGVEAGVDGGGSACVAECPASDPICTQGETSGIGLPGCNATETLLYQHSPDCLKCGLNGGCLHDMNGDMPPGSIDCEDVTGTNTVTGGTREQSCFDLLSCELPSACGASNVLDCYCGLNVNSTTCKTSQTGACVTPVQTGLESTDPNFIQANFTSTGNGTGGAAASKLLLCLRNNCNPVCF